MGIASGRHITRLLSLYSFRGYIFKCDSSVFNLPKRVVVAALGIVGLSVGRVCCYASGSFAWCGAWGIK